MIKYVIVYLVSMFKFVGGPVMGSVYGLNMLETILPTVLGMMTTVVVIYYFGIKLRAWIMKKYNVNRRKFTKRNRRIVTIWRSYGVFGVSFFTPVIFSPIIGTLLVTTLGGKRNKVFLYMLVSAVFWAVTISSLSEVVLKILF